LKLHTRGFQKTNNGFLLISPDESYEQNRSPIVEIDQQGKVLNLMGGEMMEKLAIPMKYFQKVANSIYINDMFNNQIVVFNMDSNTIEYLKFGIEDGSSFQIIDFWQVSPENCFVMTAVTKGEDDSIVISSIEKEEFVSNFSSFVCSLDLLTMSSFPTNDDKGEFDYTLLTDEYFPAFSAYLDNATTASGSLTSRDDEYTYEDFSVKKEKFDANRAKIQGIMGENKILMRKYLRK
jgi:hypothetical protein